MADERSRRLEREAASGDAAAAEQLYWAELRNQSVSELLDRMVETVLTAANREAPTVWDKLRWLRGLPPQDTSQADLALLSQHWSQVNSVADLHRVPRMVRQSGFTVYAQEQREVYRYSTASQWERVCKMSQRPPTRRFHVFDTLRDRDAANLSSGDSCLVLQNGGVYEARIDHNPYRPPGGINWSSVRFEKAQ
jgi:hypothetical protein